MAKNDAIVLKANFQSWKTERGDGIDYDPWLYYCIEQFVKAFTLDDEEIESGITDGGNDGGADAIFFLVNQGQLVSEETKLDAKSVSKIRLLFMQVKTSGGFKPTEIEKFIELTDDFLDLEKQPSSFGTRYNESVKAAMKLWKERYLTLTSEFPEVTVDYYYITGDDTSPDDYARDSAARVTAKAHAHLSKKATCNFHFVGAAELWDQVQQRPLRTKTLKWSETPMSATEGTVGLAKLSDFFEFIQDEPGILAERFFESNVRGYQQDVTVNRGIAASLDADPTAINFWLLNNGVTIITPKASPAGHKQISIQDPQIVNGLQTSREIFNHFSESSVEDDARSVLVRVIETADENVQAEIIKATNSQNKMGPNQLRMTDQIHRDIEQFFKTHGLFYDRRKGYYRDQGKPVSKIVSANELAQAVIAVLLQRPADARARPGDYFKDDVRYKQIFEGSGLPLSVYLTCYRIVHTVAQYLRAQGVDRGVGNNLKYYVAALVAKQLTKMAEPPPERIVALKLVTSVDEAILQEGLRLARRAYDRLTAKADGDVVARGTELTRSLNRAFKLKLTAEKKASAAEGSKSA